MDIDEKEREIQEFMENLKTLVSKIDPKLAGYLIGSITPKVYELFSDEQKRKWKEIFPVHHGEVGIVLSGISIISRLILELFPSSNKHLLRFATHSVAYPFLLR